MHTCIKQLLDEVANPRPEDVECMCKLLVTGGGLLDSSTKTVKNFNNGKPAPTKVRCCGHRGSRDAASHLLRLDTTACTYVGSNV